MTSRTLPMADFNIRSDSVNVEQIMEQIRSRILEKRGVDYTEQAIRELAAVKLEKFLDPRSVRSTLLEEFRRQPSEPPSYALEAEMMFESHSAPVRWIRRLLRPVLKLFFNPNALIQAFAHRAEVESARHALYYELIHNLVLETTRQALEVRNLQMRVASLASRVDFDERRARALESVVVYRPSGEEAEAGGGVAAPAEPPSLAEPPEGPGQRSRRWRRRRGRRGGGSASTVMGSQMTTAAKASGERLEQTFAVEAIPTEPSVEPPPVAPADGGTVPGRPEPGRGPASSGQAGVDDEQ